MEQGLIDSAARIDQPDDRRMNAITVAQVVKNCDETHAGRVQVRLPWLPGYEPWARLALVDRGMFFIPQEGDEVLVQMNRGDVSEVYVIGCLWNGRDNPPKQPDGSPSDPKKQRIIRTPDGQDMTFDDQTRTLTITSADKRRITLSKEKVEIAIDEQATSKIAIDQNGNVTISAKASIKLEAPSISISGDNLEIKSKAKADINGGSLCSIDAGLIKIG